MKYKYIDSLRGLAILGVLLNHNLNMGTTSGKIPTILLVIFQIGSLGVQLFFVLSALTLFFSFNSRQHIEQNPVKNFYLRRFFRIAPLFYLSIVYYLWQDGSGPRYWLGDANHISIANILSNFTFTFGFNPYWLMSVVPNSWTIAVEFVFYLTMPLLFYKIRSINNALIFIMGSYLIWNILNYFFSSHILISDEKLWGAYLYFYFPTQLPIFGLGIFLFFILRKKPVELKPFGLFILVSYIFIIYICNRSNIKLFLVNIEFILSISFALLIYVLHNKPYKIIVNTFTSYVGKISFSIYLCHDAVMHFMRKFSLESFINSNGKYDAVLDYGIRFLIFLILVTAISSLTYYFIEIPGQKLGNWLINKTEGKQNQFSSSNLPPVQL
jgi:peptidoglycan/LPS O-acetylase OafA/YrhL